MENKIPSQIDLNILNIPLLLFVYLFIEFYRLNGKCK